MRKKFEGQIHSGIPAGWDQLTHENPLMNSGLLEILKTANPDEFKTITHRDYCCCEYKTKMNILTFSRFKLNISLNVIALPVSLCAPGYSGNLKALIEDYKKRKGLFLILNIEEKPAGIDAAAGETLGNCIFTNRFLSFDEYLFSMKSNYRRRIKAAMKKGKALEWKHISAHEFTEDVYRLYQNVFNRSKYPLECLKPDFFRLFPGEIYCFFDKAAPLAFVHLSEKDSRLSFIFGGMDYASRDRYDLYMNMLIFIVSEGIRRNCSVIELGQTAEDSKMRVGAVVSPRYLCIFSGSAVKNAILKCFAGMFTLKNSRLSYSVWKRDTPPQEEVHKPVKTQVLR